MAQGVAPAPGGGRPGLTLDPNRRKMGSVRPNRVVLALALCLTLLAACGSEGTPEATPSPASGDLGKTELVLGLCAVQGSLEAGDVEGAEVTFEDEVHEPLHELADEAESADREAAADLLEAKQRVEAGFAASTPASELTADVAALLAATSAAMETLGLQAPACPA